MNQEGEFQFQYLMQFVGLLRPVEIQGLRVNNTELYLFTGYRNLVIFDLLLNTEIVRTQYRKPCTNFISTSFIAGKDGDHLVTVNEGESWANLWIVDKIKRTLRVQQILRDKTDRPITWVLGCKKELWVLRDSYKNIDVYSFDD